MKQFWKGLICAVLCFGIVFSAAACNKAGDPNEGEQQVIQVVPEIFRQEADTATVTA